MREGPAFSDFTNVTSAGTGKSVGRPVGPPIAVISQIGAKASLRPRSASRSASLSPPSPPQAAMARPSSVTSSVWEARRRRIWIGDPIPVRTASGAAKLRSAVHELTEDLEPALDRVAKLLQDLIGLPLERAPPDVGSWDREEEKARRED